MDIKIRKIKKSEELQAKKLILSILKNEFYKEAKAYPQNDLENIRKSYGDEREIFLVAEKDKKIIGTSAIKEDDITTALLRRVFVHPDFRHKGYGLKLVDKAISFSKKQNYKKIIFNGTSKMTGALNLCKKKGFDEEATINMGNIIIYRYALALNSAHPA